MAVPLGSIAFIRGGKSDTVEGDKVECIAMIQIAVKWPSRTIDHRRKLIHLTLILKA